MRSAAHSPTLRDDVDRQRGTDENERGRERPPKAVAAALQPPSPACPDADRARRRSSPPAPRAIAMGSRAPRRHRPRAAGGRAQRRRSRHRRAVARAPRHRAPSAREGERKLRREARRRRTVRRPETRCHRCSGRTRAPPSPAHQRQPAIGAASSGSAMIRVMRRSAGDDRRDERARDDDSAHASIGRLRRHAEMMLGGRAGELVLEREARGAGDARGSHRRQLDGRDAHLRRGDHRFDRCRRQATPRVIGARARATAGGIEQSPRSARSGSGGAARRTRSVVMREQLMRYRGPWRGSLLDHLPDDGRRSAAAATKERARTRQCFALSRLDRHVEIAAPDGERALARKRRALWQPRPEIGDRRERLGPAIGDQRGESICRRARRRLSRALRAAPY